MNKPLDETIQQSVQKKLAIVYTLDWLKEGASTLENLTNKALAASPDNKRKLDERYFPDFNGKEFEYLATVCDGNGGYFDGLLGYAIVQKGHYKNNRHQFEFHYLDKLMVDPSVAKNGVGRDLFKAVVDKATQRDMPLIARVHNKHGNHEFYKAMGELAEEKGLEHGIVKTNLFQYRIFGGTSNHYRALKENVLPIAKPQTIKPV